MKMEKHNLGPQAAKQLGEAGGHHKDVTRGSLDDIRTGAWMREEARKVPPDRVRAHLRALLTRVGSPALDHSVPNQPIEFIPQTDESLQRKYIKFGGFKIPSAAIEAGRDFPIPDGALVVDVPAPSIDVHMNINPSESFVHTFHVDQYQAMLRAIADQSERSEPPAQ